MEDEQPHTITLKAIHKGNGYQSILIVHANDALAGVEIASQEAFPTKAEAIEQAAWKLLKTPHLLNPKPED